MKIGIITFTYGQNYGNKLQNYALLQVLKRICGDGVYTLQNFDVAQKNVVAHLKNAVKVLFDIKAERKKRSKQKKIDLFSQIFLNYYRVPLTSETTVQLNDFDVFVCGSDQIWNPYYNQHMDLFTASFADGARRVSYAASIGLSELPEELIDNYTQTVGTMDYIGVREEEAAALIKKICGRNATVQIDPTMLLTAEDWRKFSQKPHKKLPNKYIVTYFVRSMNDSAKAALKELVTRENLEIIRLNDSHCKEWYDIAPDEFVWLLGHAEYVLTDSFHATVFSLLFHRPFRCFERESGEVKNRQESRLNTLLNYFGLGSCIGAEGGLDYKNISFDRVDEILADKRKASIDSLIEALEL